MNAIAITPTTVNPSIQNPKVPQQRQTAKEAIATNVKALIEQLEQGHSESLQGNRIRNSGTHLVTSV